MIGKQVLLRSSHLRLGVASQTKLKVSWSSTTKQQADRWERESQRQMSARIKREIDKIAKSAMKRFRAPKDGIVRAVAHEAAVVRRRSDRISRFDKVVRVYAGMQLGYSDRYVVTEYAYLRLKQLIEERREALAKHVDGLVKRHYRQPLFLKMKLDEEVKSLHRNDLEHLAERVFREIEGHILSIAELGRPVKPKLTRGRVAVRGTIGMHRNFPCFVILEEADDGVRVVAFTTSRQFNRKVRRRMRHGGGQKFANVPSQLRH